MICRRTKIKRVTLLPTARSHKHVLNTRMQLFDALCFSLPALKSMIVKSNSITAYIK